MSDRPLALVTGGSRGVGRAVVLELAKDHRVVFSCRRDIEAAEEVVSLVAAAGGEARYLVADLSLKGAALELAAAAEILWGPVAALVGNAGSASRGHSAVDTQHDEYSRMMQIHAWSNVELAAAVMPSLRVQRGSAVFVTSAVSETLPPNTAPYAAAKAAMEAIAVVMAREERQHGVRVNLVAPGLVATDMGDRLMKASGSSSAADLDASSPLGHVCRPEEVAGVVGFLCSASASYVAGHRLRVDGGGPDLAMVPGAH